MNRIDVQLRRAAKGASVMGSGFVALDLVLGREGLLPSAGGSCGNVLIVLSWLGWMSAPVARLGTDKVGDFVVGEMERAGVNLKLLQRTDAVPTPVVIQQFVEDGSGGRKHRFSLVCPECGAWLPRYRAITLAFANQVVHEEAPRAFYFDRTSPATVVLAEWAKQKGALVLFEPSSIGEDALFERAVDTCHILKFSEERFGRDSELCNARGPQLVVRTMGSEGLEARWKGRWSRLQPFAAMRVVDAAGAGDWCSVALLHALGQKGAEGFAGARKADIEYGLRLGQALAALNCGFEGARGLMAAARSTDNVNRMLRNAPGGGGVIADADLVPRKSHVAICKLCSDEGWSASMPKGAKRMRA